MSRRQPPLVPRMVENVYSIFGEMSALAVQVGAINLGQGFPDTDGPEVLKNAAIEAIRAGRGNQYPPVHGLPELRRAIADHQQRFYNVAVDWQTEVVVGTGASEVLQAALLALVEPGDEVIVFEPWFDLYAAGINLAGATRVAVPMVPPTYRPDVEALRAAVTPRTRVLLINTPHNPTGIVFTREELQVIADIACENDLIVLSDEVYEHLVFDGREHVSMATLPGMAERTITVGSGGKCFSFTGWKVGWATGPADLIGAVRAVRQHLSFVSGGPFQWAMAEGLALPGDYFSGLARQMQDRRDQLTSGLAELGFGIVPSEGTYFLTTDVRPLGYADGLTFCRDAVERCRVVAIPHQAFCDDPGERAGYVRWAFCKQPAVLDEALERLSPLADRS